MKSQPMNWPMGGFVGGRHDWPGTMKHALEPTANRAWVVDADGYDELREGSLESRFAISNGFLGVRGTRAISRGARWVAPPRTYVASSICRRACAEPSSAARRFAKRFWIRSALAFAFLTAV